MKEIVRLLFGLAFPINNRKETQNNLQSINLIILKLLSALNIADDVLIYHRYSSLGIKISISLNYLW